MTKAKLMRVPGQAEPILNCWCHYCEGEWKRVMDDLDPDGWMRRLGGMIVCPTCGSKRCPHATYHDHKCTKSNDAGQAGSVYGTPEIDIYQGEDDAEDPL